MHVVSKLKTVLRIIRQSGISGVIKTLKFQRAIRNHEKTYDTFTKANPYFERSENLKNVYDNIRKNNGKVIVTFPVIPWNFRWQRPQHILSKFARDGYTILYISLFDKGSGQVHKRLDQANESVQIFNLAENVFDILITPSTDFNIFKQELTGDNLNNILTSLHSVLDPLFFFELLYMIHFPGWWPVVQDLKRRYKGKVIFDCMDDHSGFSNNSGVSVEMENELASQSDLVIASSYKLEEKNQKLNKHTILVKNGTQFEHFNNAEPNGELAKFKDKPLIGYYGAISDWFDTDIVLFCATSKPEWNFVLIGSTSGADISELERLPNVYFLGEKEYKVLPGYLHDFDICTIPFKVIPLTLATNPVKFYEYMSAGKPVVSVKLPELEYYYEYCYLAENKEEFLAQLERALKEKDDPTLITKRIELAKDNSWEQRYKTIKLSIMSQN